MHRTFVTEYLAPLLPAGHELPNCNSTDQIYETFVRVPYVTLIPEKYSPELQHLVQPVRNTNTSLVTYIKISQTQTTVDMVLLNTYHEKEQIISLRREEKS